MLASDRLRAYVALTKPAIVVLLLITTAGAMILAADGLPPAQVLALTILGGALTAGGSGVLNQYVDRAVDGTMSRTRGRPIPTGRVSSREALLLGLAMCMAGVLVLGLGVNWLSSGLALIGIIYYVALYGVILKPSTTANIVVGGGAGAIPPLVGWAAVTGSLNMPAFFLFALIFFWTPPHFWALALIRRTDYERAGIPMLPVVEGVDHTKNQILLYSVQVVALTLLFPLVGLGRMLYVVVAIALGVGLLAYAQRLRRGGGNRAAWGMYRFSNLYLTGVFAALVLNVFVPL